MVVRARGRPSGQEVISSKFRSTSSKATRAYRPRGLPNLRTLHLFLPWFVQCCPGDSDPICVPGRRAAWWVGSTRPTDEGALRQGGSRERRLGRWSHVGVDEVPCQGRSGRTRGRRSPTSPPQHPQRGTCLHLLGAGTSTSTIAFSGGWGTHTPRMARWWYLESWPLRPGREAVGSTGRASGGSRGPG